MEVSNFILDLNNKNLIEFDFKSEHEYVGITRTNEIITPFSNFEIRSDVSFPIIRMVEEDLFLVIDARTKKDNKNCFVYDYKGTLINKFYLGDGIEEVIIVKKNIIVSYFDEGVFGSNGPNNNGLSIFNLNGELLFGYNGNGRQCFIADCYCMCKFDNQSVLFLAYTDFNLIELNIITHKEIVHKIPPNLYGSNALTTWKKKIYFSSPYDDQDGIYKWELGNENANKIGNYKGNLRGIPNGKFLNFNNKSYTIIEMN